MTEKEIVGGIDVIPSHMLPNGTMYVSMDIYEYMVEHYGKGDLNG